MTPEEHGRRLRVALLQKGMTGRDLADAVGVSLRTAHNWLNGRSLPTLDHYLTLCRLLGDYDND